MVKYELNEKGKEYLRNIFCYSIADVAIKDINNKLNNSRYITITDEKIKILVKFSYRFEYIALALSTEYLDVKHLLEPNEIKPGIWYNIKDINLDHCVPTLGSTIVVIKEISDENKSEYLRITEYRGSECFDSIVNNRELYKSKQILFLPA